MSKFRNKVGLVGLVAISFAVMGPSMAVSLNPQAIAGQVGTAVPTAFLLAVIPLSIITYSFVVLTKRRGSRGSLYGLVGAEVGPRTGTVAGLWLVFGYLTGASITAVSFGIFTANILKETLWEAAPGWLPLLLAVFILPITSLLATRTISALGRLLLVLEGLTMVAILAVSARTLSKLMTEGGPQGQSVDWSVLQFGGVTVSGVALALTFALLSSAGFEGAAAAGEETGNPRKSIPRALVLTTAVSSGFYIFVALVAVWAFGSSETQIATFTKSGSIVSDMADTYVSSGVGDLIMIGGAVSSFACMIGAQIAAGRILSIFGRDKVVSSRFGVLSDRGTPVRATYAAGASALVLTVFAALATGFNSFSAFEMVSDMAGLLFSAAYATACVAAVTALVREGKKVLAAIPLLGIAVLATVFLLQLFPVPSGWELIAPVFAIVALVAGAVVGRLRGNWATKSLAS